MLEGDTVDALAALDEREIDLLVCGSRGYGPVRRVLLGGVLRKLVRRAACPVVVVPRGAVLSGPSLRASLGGDEPPPRRLAAALELELGAGRREAGDDVAAPAGRRRLR